MTLAAYTSLTLDSSNITLRGKIILNGFAYGKGPLPSTATVGQLYFQYTD
jgi:hypothetical protein